MRHIRHCVYFRVSSLMNQATWLIKVFSPFSIMGKSPSMRRGWPFFTSCHFPFPCCWGCCLCYHGSSFEYGANRSRAEELWSSCNAHWNHWDSAHPNEDKDLQDSLYLCVQWRCKSFYSQACTEIQPGFENCCLRAQAFWKSSPQQRL